MKRIIALVIFCALVSMTSLSGQATSHFSVQYDMSFGTGDLANYISAPSFRGASAQYRYAVSHNILVGMDAAWNVFYDKRDYDSYTKGTQTLSGVQYRYQNEVPLLVAADYVISPDKDFQPYIGLGIGTMYSERILDMGIWEWEENPWHFAVKPEVGMMFRMSGGAAFKLSAKYYEGFASGDLESQGYFTISAGIAWNW